MFSIRRGLWARPGQLNWSPFVVEMNFGIIRGINEIGTTILPVEPNVKQTLACAHRDYVLSQSRMLAPSDGAAPRENAEVRVVYFGRN